jgi:hypothetical protein
MMRNLLLRVSFSLCFDGFRTAAVGAKAPTRSDTLEILICVNVYERKAEDSPSGSDQRNRLIHA